jgi:hypothetical protein
MLIIWNNEKVLLIKVIKGLERHLTPYVDAGHSANPRRERIFTTHIKEFNISNNDKISRTHMKYQTNEKLFKRNYDHQLSQVERIYKPKRYLEDQLEVSS